MMEVALSQFDRWIIGNFIVSFLENTQERSTMACVLGKR
ncbi:unnamed protein product [Acidithrix sp. C25]|nr:unnamed protein product [Acidithrix sp. C25]